MAVFEVTNSLGFTHQYPTDSSTWRAEYKQLYNADIVSERVLGVDEVPPGQASSVGPDPSLPKATFPESPVTPPPTPLTAEPPRSVDQIIQDAAERAIEQFKARAGEFDTRNPFAFDEVLARQAAEQQNEPFYQQQLSDFLQGIETQRRRSTEDEQAVLSELRADTQSYRGRVKQEIDRALNASREGFADANLFFSGRRIREEGMIERAGATNLSEFLRTQGVKEQQTQLGGARIKEELLTKQTLGQRDIGRARQFDVEQDIIEAKRRAAVKREFERGQFLGPAPGEPIQEFEGRQFESLYRGL